jgi:hypothetical protein
MRSFLVSALWDDEAKVFYSDSDIIGLHIEEPTIKEFEATMMALAPALIMENHISKADVARKPIADLIPSIFFRPPECNLAHA